MRRANARVAIDAFSAAPRQLFDAGSEGLEKLFVTVKLLELRRRDPDLFARGSYVVAAGRGRTPRTRSAFARVRESRVCVVVVPRWSAKLLHGATELPTGEVWGETSIQATDAIPAGLRDVFTGRELSWRDSSGSRSWNLADVLREFPVAVLTS